MPSPRSGSDGVGASWRASADPRAAHRLAELLLPPAAYAHTRGVAQQAARLVHDAGLGPDMRRLILAAAWLHDIGCATGGPRGAARSLRWAGNEDLARIVAHQAGAVDDPRGPSMEFPAPRGRLRRALGALDIAIVTTDQAGGRVTPREGVGAVAAARGASDPRVRALVARVAELAQDPEAAAWMRSLSPAPA